MTRALPRFERSRGFSLIELLLVLGIIGIISAIAIPSFMGQRRRARVVGDAQANARVLAMQLEGRKAENGIYATSGTKISWTGATPTHSTFLPGFTVKNTTQMNYSLTVNAGGVGYLLTVTDPLAGSATVLTANQAGAITLDSSYNK